MLQKLHTIQQSQSFFKKSLLAITIACLLIAQHADAKRMGSGKSSGRQNNTANQNYEQNKSVDNNVYKQDASKQTNTNANSAQNTSTQTANGISQIPAKKPFGMGAILGGIAAGLGLAWLASQLGLGDAFANIALFALLGIAALFLFRLFKQRKANSTNLSYASVQPTPNINVNANGMQNHSGYAFTPKPAQASNMINSANASQLESLQQQTPLYQNHSNNSGNMASSVFEQAIPNCIQQLLVNADNVFMNIQALSDRRDLAQMSEYLSSEFLIQIKEELTGAAQQTHVQNLQSRLLDWQGANSVDLNYLVTIHYHADVNENNEGFNTINEAWTFTAAKHSVEQANFSAKDWKLTGITQLN